MIALIGWKFRRKTYFLLILRISDRSMDLVTVFKGRCSGLWWKDIWSTCQWRARLNDVAIKFVGSLYCAAAYFFASTKVMQNPRSYCLLYLQVDGKNMWQIDTEKFNVKWKTQCYCSAVTARRRARALAARFPNMECTLDYYRPTFHQHEFDETLNWIQLRIFVHLSNTQLTIFHF